MSDAVGALHVHSDYSHDGIDSLEHLREVSISRRLEWISLTEHAEDFDEETFAEYYRHCAALSDRTLRYIPGLEFRFRGFRGVHLLALGVSRWTFPKSFAEFFDRADAEGWFTILAHPVLCRYAPPPVVTERVGAIEIWNPRYGIRSRPDPVAIELYRSIAATRPGLVATAGLDQHDSAYDAGLRTVLRGTTTDPIRALRSGVFTSTGNGWILDADVPLTPGTMQRLKLRHAAATAIRSASRRLVDAARNLGIK